MKFCIESSKLVYIVLIFSSDFIVPLPDIVDEAIRSFRWNILFRNFEVLGGADRVLVYLTLWILRCIAGPISSA